MEANISLECHTVPSNHLAPGLLSETRAKKQACFSVQSYKIPKLFCNRRPVTRYQHIIHFWFLNLGKTIRFGKVAILVPWLKTFWSFREEKNCTLLAGGASARIECALYCYTKPDGRFYLWIHTIIYCRFQSFYEMTNLQWNKAKISHNARLYVCILRFYKFIPRISGICCISNKAERSYTLLATKWERYCVELSWSLDVWYTTKVCTDIWSFAE
jgi:hypothetical protein